MARKLGSGAAFVLVGLLAARDARADDTSTTTLAATDFTLTLASVDGAGDATTLTADQLATYFSLARCACPTNVVATLVLGATAAAALGTHAVDAQLMVGSDCDNATATACTSVGTALTLSSSKTSTGSSVATSAIFTAAGRTTCTAASTSSTRLWAIVRLDGTRLSSEPSLLLTLGGAGPKAPTAVTAQSADEGLLVSWTPSGDATTVRGHQVLCSPGLATAATARYDTCGTTTSTPDGGTNPFASLDAQFVCSDLVAVGTKSVRIHGLENGRTYQIAVVAVGVDGTPSAVSTIAAGTPGPTVGFGDLYKDDGGTATGCALAAHAPRGGAAALALGLLLARARRRGGRRAGHRGGRRAGPAARRGALWLVVVGGVTSAIQTRAHAAFDDASSWVTTSAEAPAPASPRAWNLELRFAPYRPDVDAELAARGSSERPYERIFSSSRRLMTQLELDRQLLRRAGGTWAVGLGVGYFHASAAALSSNLTTRSGDQTGLRLVPLSAALVYRADVLHERYRSPFVPYAKLGLDCTLWKITDTSQADINGRTFGWHAAVGASVDLSSLDPDATRALDGETGINQMAAFFEVARFSLDGFGAPSALHVGDTTWFAGLMFEF